MKEDFIIDNKSEIKLIYWIGENAQDNWDIISKANQNDIWFHVAGSSSSHIILRMPNKVSLKDISKQTLIHCSSVCKQHSKSKNNNKVKIVFTEIKNVKKADKPGAVYTKKERYITI